MLLTDDPQLANVARTLRSHGGRRDGAALRFDRAGFNYRLSELQAALGLEQMGRIEQILADRRATAELYDEALSSLVGVHVPRPPDDAVWSYQSYVIVLDLRFDRERVIEAMSQFGIETTIGTYACHQHDAYRAFSSEGLQNAERYADQSLTLPIIPGMTSEQIGRVVTALEGCLV